MVGDLVLKTPVNLLGRICCLISVWTVQTFVLNGLGNRTVTEGVGPVLWLQTGGLTVL